MKRVEQVESLVRAGTRVPKLTSEPGSNEPNFGLLASDPSWRNTWSAIVPGRFTSSVYTGLLFVEESTAYAELWATDGQGHIVAPPLGTFSPLGNRTTWTLIVPGNFGPSGFTGLLLYDQAAGFGRIYDTEGKGDLVLLNEYSGWRTSWTHIVSGRFIASSPYSSVFFYDASAGYGEIWATDGTGLVGNAPFETFSPPDTSVSGAGTYTHVLAGDFHWTPDFISEAVTLTDLLFYDAVSGRGDMFRCVVTPDPAVFQLAASSQVLPIMPTSVAVGNFGGVGNTDVAFYDGPAGTLNIYSFADSGDTPANPALREFQTGLSNTVDLIIPGNFWMSNPDDHWFNDGPPVTTSPPFDPDWRFGTGAFSDFLFYDRNAGLGAFYWHQAAGAPAALLEGYITSRSSHGGAMPVATGSVLPGESISFHVSSQYLPYSITIYLQGLFAGAPEQMMAEIEGLPGNPVPSPVSLNAYKDGAQWPVVATFAIPPTWPTGLYLARVQTTAAATVSYSADLPFVVRARPGCETGVLLVLADTTQYAYNDWGGRNAYGNVSAADFAGAFPSATALRVPYGFQLSFERPLHGGFGNTLQAWDIPFIQWLARRGVPIDVCTCRDLNIAPPSTQTYRLLLFAGHHEYWTAQMRNSVEGFAASGGNVAFFSGNVCWWQIRINTDGTQLICYKVAAFDPVSTTADHVLTTVHWFDDLVKRPETALTGVSWLGDDAAYGDPDHRYKVENAGSWVFEGTGLANGDTFGGYSSKNDGNIDSSVCGGETDRVQTNGPNGLNSPPNYTVASIYDTARDPTTGTLLYPTLEVGNMGVFSPAGSSGVVFNAATINWAPGLSRVPDNWNTMDQITLNVIAKLGPPRPGPWTTASGGRSTPGAPVTAVVTAPNQIALFLSDPGGGIFTTSGNAREGWAEWTTVSGGQSTPGAPVTAVVTAPNRITLFLSDPGGGIFTTSGNASEGWAGWTTVSGGQSTPGAPVTAVVTAPNQITLFLSDPGGGVFTTSGNASEGWAGWTTVSGGQSTPGAPVTAVVTAPNQITLFLSDPGGGVFTTSGDASEGWAGWTTVSGGQSTPGAPVTAVVTAPNRIAVFLSDPQGGIYTTSGNASEGWQLWTSVAEGVATPGAPTSAVATADGRVRLFRADTAGGVCATLGNAGVGWQPWASVAEGQSTPGAAINAVVPSQNSVALFLSNPAGSTFTSSMPLITP